MCRARADRCLAASGAERLVEVLRFYADRANWNSERPIDEKGVTDLDRITRAACGKSDFYANPGKLLAVAVRDMGDRARTVIAEWETN